MTWVSRSAGMGEAAAMLAIEVTRMRADFIFVGRVIKDSGVVAAKVTDLEIWTMLNTGRYFMYFPICLRMGLLLFGADSKSRRYCLAKVPFSAWPILAKSGTIIEEWHYIYWVNASILPTIRRRQARDAGKSARSSS